MCALYMLLISLFISSATAQLTTGNINGTVSDSSGAAVPGAKISAKNTETGVMRETVSGNNGHYEIPNLPSGSYEVTATVTGFQTSVRSGITLSVGQNAIVDHKMQVGAVTQEVTVTGEAPVVETTSATVSQLVDEQKVQDLPLRGRDLTQLMFLQPGVLKTPGTAAVGFSGMGDKITVNGARQTQNLFLLDGVANSDLSDNPQGASGSYTGAETVKEFQIITNNYSAEYQSAAGAIVSAITKSGTNSIHGSGFETARTSKLDANSWDNNNAGVPKREFTRNQYGGSVGGPIKKDKSFYFGSYEGFKERNNNADQVQVYSPAVRAGQVPSTDTTGSGSLTGPNAGKTVTVNPVIKSYLNLWPEDGVPYDFAKGQTFSLLTRNTTNGIDTLVAPGADQRPVNEDFFAGHFDQLLGNGKAGTLSLTYNFDRSDSLPTDLMINVGSPTSGNSPGRTKKHVLGAKHLSVLSPTKVNEFNFGYSFSSVDIDLPLTNTDFGSTGENLATLNGRTLVAQLAAPGGVSGVGWRLNHSLYDQVTYQFKDGLSISHGSHSFRMGAEIKLFRYEQDSCSQGCNGIWSWGSISDFLQNVPSTLQVFEPGHDNPVRHLKQLLFGGYFQDNWQTKPSFTLNLGLRYEFVTVPTESSGLVSTLVNPTDPWVTVTTQTLNDPRYKNDKFCNTPGVSPTCASSAPLDGFFKNPSLRSFSPRLGFAYSPGSHKFSLRGGAGMFYEFPLLFTIRTSLQESPPFVVSGTVDSTVFNTSDSTPAIKAACDASAYCRYLRSGGTPLTLTPGIGSNAGIVSLLAATPSSRSMEYSPKDSRVYRWSLTLQQDLGRGMSISAGYTGSRGTHLWGQTEANSNQWVGYPLPPTGDKIFPIQTSDRSKGCLAGNTLDACAAPFAGLVNPFFSELRLQNADNDSYYHGLAIGFNQKRSHGLEYSFSYNWSKSIDTGSGVTSSGENLPQSQRGMFYWDLGRKRGLSAFDIRNNVSMNYSYLLPGQTLKGFTGAIAGGWQLNGILTLTGGHPLWLGSSPTITKNAIGGNNSGSAENNPVNLVSGSNTNPIVDSRDAVFYYNPLNFLPADCTGFGPNYAGKSLQQIQQMIAADLAATPAIPVPAICAPGDPQYHPGHFGNLGRDTMISPGLANMDISVQKNFRVTENQKLQFRAEAFNLFNRVNLSNPGTTPYSSSDVPSSAAFGVPTTNCANNGCQISSTDLRPRTLQLGLKYTF